MAQIVESDNAQILKFVRTLIPRVNRMEVTLEVNKQDISAILSTLIAIRIHH